MLWLKINITSLHNLSCRFVKPRTKGYTYIIAPKHVYDELVKSNGISFRGKCLIIEDAKTTPKIINPNTIIFTSLN